MSQARKVAVLVGSLRKESLNRKAAKALTRLAPGHLEFSFVEIGDLPFFNQDLEETPPQPWVEFRDAIRDMDAVLFVTPEYNRSVPAALKNALDVGSRPYGHSVWKGKAAAVISVSPSAIGGFGANHHLRQSLVFLDMPTLAQPEAYVGGAGDMFDDEGGVKKPGTETFLKGFIDAFADWIEKTR